jgi:protein involved in polysaccharide export with SLBB domain
MVMFMKTEFLKKQIAFLLLSVFAWQTIAVAQEKKEPREVRLKAGDAIRILVYDGVFPTDNNKFISNFHNAEFVVDGLGEIRLYSLGKIKVAGHTSDEISELIKEKLKPFTKEPMVITIPLIKVSLKGNFGRPGMYRFNLEESFWQVVDEAGGIGNLSSIEGMYIIRKDEILYQNFEDAFYNASSLYEMGIQSGDELVAPRINTISLYTIQRYFEFMMSIFIFYFTLQSYRNR